MQRPLLKILIPVLVGVVVIGAGVTYFATRHTHDFVYVKTDPTCLAEGANVGTCSCGETKSVVIPKIEHEWENANCTQPKTCSLCSLVDSSTTALGHSWQEATCAAPKTCATCGETEGEALSHTWQEATCEDAKTCTICGAIEGEALNHNFVNKQCTICGNLDYTSNEYFAFNLEYDTYSIMVADGKANELPADVMLPASYEGRAVTKIDSLQGCTNLASIIIPDSITTISKNAFKDCENLASITIGAGVTTIGERAFSDCAKLVEVINKSQLNIEKGSDDYGYLGYNALSVSNREDAYVSKVSIDNGYVIYTDGAQKILLGYSGSESALTLPDGITKIRNNAFEGNISLVSIVIPASVKEIDSKAFSACTGLTSVVIGDSVTLIGSSAFDGCSSLTDVNYLGSIDSWAQIEFANYAANPMSMSQACVLKINGEVVTQVNLTSATKVSNYAFYNCTNITSLTIGASVKTIGQDAFIKCGGLNTIIINEGLTAIDTGAFNLCNALSTVDYKGTIDGWAQIEFGNEFSNPMSVTGKLVINGTEITEVNLTTASKISNYAFYKCINITSVMIGEDSVASIGVWAFGYCNNLSSIVISKSVTSIGECAVEGVGSLTINYVGTQAEWNGISKSSKWKGNSTVTMQYNYGQN